MRSKDSRENIRVTAVMGAAKMAAAAILPLLLLGTAATADDPKPRIRQVDVVHFSHTDYGFTDHPAVCRELQVRFLDLAVDAATATRDQPPEGRFAWTAETTVAVDDWWKAATTERREEFLSAVRAGQLEVAALPHNQTATLDEHQWQTMLHWLDEDLWQQVQPQVAIQNDVNGFPRAGAMALLDRGIGHFMSGINEDSGGCPLPRPSAFWWKMPDGRRLFVYLNYSYPMGYWFFEPHEWRRGPVPRAADTRYRPPRAGDFFRSDEASVRQAHRHLTQRIRGLESAGYRYPILVISVTNQWRIDNDPPFPPLADFVAAWNRLGLEPKLRLTTASTALKTLAEAVGSQIPEHQGEWTDWWVNGVASGPREVAASRAAKRSLRAAQSPLWGELDAKARQTLAEIYRDLCLFDEHTWGSDKSVALPYDLDTLGQFNEKAGFAYRSMARAEWLLAQRVRSRLAGEPEGLYLANSAKLPASGWVRMPATCLREPYRSLIDVATGAKRGLFFENGMRPFTRPENPAELSPENTAATFPDRSAGQAVKFWTENIPGESIQVFRLSTEAAHEPAPQDVTPQVEVDARGWPRSAVWPGMKRPLFLTGLGGFSSVEVEGFAPRWVAKDVWAIAGEAEREKIRQEKLKHTTATSDHEVVFEENPHTLTYSQTLTHPRCQWLVRELELWKREPRARLTVRFYRLPSEAPEALFVNFLLPCEGRLPQASSGGVPFTAYTDQLPGTCRDYFAVDGWLRYEMPEGNWFWVSRDAPLVSLGGEHLLSRHTTIPAEPNRVMAMLYNSFWYTNFVGDSPGVMEFQFDLAWKEKQDANLRPQDLAETLVAEPQVMIQPALSESPAVIQRIYRP